MHSIADPIKTLLLPICYRAFSQEKSMTLPVMLGGHSGLEPPLPISNRAVKRTSANDSMLFACESRSPPSYLYPISISLLDSKPPCGGFLFIHQRDIKTNQKLFKQHAIITTMHTRGLDTNSTQTIRSRDELARSIVSDNLVVGIKGDDLSRSEVSNDFGLNRLRYDL